MEIQNVLSNLWEKMIKVMNLKIKVLQKSLKILISKDVMLPLIHLTMTSHSERKYLLSMGLLDNSEPYNSDITTNNVKSSFRSIRGKFTPGPDDILPRMLIEAEEQLIESATKLFQLCWENGHNPSLWNKDNKIYILKPGKENYNLPKSYRSISLTSVTGKMVERISTLD